LTEIPLDGIQSRQRAHRLLSIVAAGWCLNIARLERDGHEGSVLAVREDKAQQIANSDGNPESHHRAFTQIVTRPPD
jgi:hypothetical protein